MEEAMIRKPILMPKNLVAKVDKIAKAKKVSFAKVVRDMVDTYSEDETPEESRMLEAMLDKAIESTYASVRKIETLEKRLDETHEMLARKGAGDA